MGRDRSDPPIGSGPSGVSFPDEAEFNEELHIRIQYPGNGNGTILRPGNLYDFDEWETFLQLHDLTAYDVYRIDFLESSISVSDPAWPMALAVGDTSRRENSRPHRRSDGPPRRSAIERPFR